MCRMPHAKTMGYRLTCSLGISLIRDSKCRCGYIYILHLLGDDAVERQFTWFESHARQRDLRFHGPGRHPILRQRIKLPRSVRVRLEDNSPSQAVIRTRCIYTMIFNAIPLSGRPHHRFQVSKEPFSIGVVNETVSKNSQRLVRPKSHHVRFRKALLRSHHQHTLKNRTSVRVTASIKGRDVEIGFPLGVVSWLRRQV